MAGAHTRSRPSIVRVCRRIYMRARPPAAALHRIRHAEFSAPGAHAASPAAESIDSFASLTSFASFAMLLG